jgi:hypothetical protein
MFRGPQLTLLGARIVGAGAAPHALGEWAGAVSCGDPLAALVRDGGARLAREPPRAVQPFLSPMVVLYRESLMEHHGIHARPKTIWPSSEKKTSQYFKTVEKNKFPEENNTKMSDLNPRLLLRYWYGRIQP